MGSIQSAVVGVQYQATPFLLARRAFCFDDQIAIVDLDGEASSYQQKSYSGWGHKRRSMTGFAVLRYVGKLDSVVRNLRAERSPFYRYDGKMDQEMSRLECRELISQVVDQAGSIEEMLPALAAVRIEEVARERIEGPENRSIFDWKDHVQFFAGEATVIEVVRPAPAAAANDDIGSKAMLFGLLNRHCVGNYIENRPDFMPVNDAYLRLLLLFRDMEMDCDERNIDFSDFQFENAENLLKR